MILALAVVVTHLLAALLTPYELHRDEFLYMAMGRHLRLFAMDFPPLIAIVSEMERWLLGDSLVSIRLGPALAHGGVVVLTGAIARRMGGGVFAQVAAALAAAVSPLYLRAGSLFQPVVFEQLWWTLAAYGLVRVGETGNEPRLSRESGNDGGRRGDSGTAPWLLVGIALGLGLLTKFSVFAFGFGIFCGLLIAGRQWLRTPGPWLAALVAFILGAPSWIGQIRLGFPVLGQMSDLQETQLQEVGYVDFLVEQVLMHGPVGAMLAAVGLFALLRDSRFARWRVLGFACLVTFIAIWLLRGKPYYVGPLFPALYAAGGIFVGRWAMVLARSRSLALRGGTLAGVIGFGAVSLPMGLPILPPQTMARYAAAVGVTAAVTTNRGVQLELPQDYADMLGWERKVETVAAAYRSLSPEEQREAVIVPDNYGQAGAIDFYGPRLGLEGVEAPVGSYWFWGPGDKPGNVIIKVGGDREDIEPYCRSVNLFTRIDEPWVVPEERDLAIWICREPHRTLQEIWPEFEGQN